MFSFELDNNQTDINKTKSFEKISKELGRVLSVNQEIQRQKLRMAVLLNDSRNQNLFLSDKEFESNERLINCEEQMTQLKIDLIKVQNEKKLAIGTKNETVLALNELKEQFMNENMLKEKNLKDRNELFRTNLLISGELRKVKVELLARTLTEENNNLSEEKCKTLVKKISDLESELNDERKRRTSAVQKLAEALEANQEEVNQNLDLQNNFRRLEDEYNSLHKDINQKDEEVQHAQSERSVCQEGKLVL